MLRNFIQLMLVFSILLFAGCTSEQERWLNKLESKAIETERAIDAIDTHLNNGAVRGFAGST